MEDGGSLHLKSRVPWGKQIDFHFGLVEPEVSIRYPREISKDYRIVIFNLWEVKHPLTGAPIIIGKHRYLLTIHNGSKITVIK